MDFLLDYNISKETIDIINKEEEPKSIVVNIVKYKSNSKSSYSPKSAIGTFNPTAIFGT